MGDNFEELWSQEIIGSMINNMQLTDDLIKVMRGVFDINCQIDKFNQSRVWIAVVEEIIVKVVKEQDEISYNDVSEEATSAQWLLPLLRTRAVMNLF